MEDQFAADMKAAEEAFTVTHEGSWLTYPAFVEAEAKTGSRYVVVASRLDDGFNGGLAEIEGGRFLLTVVWPWQDAKIVNGQVEESYIAEHLCGSRHYQGLLNGGDLKALTLACRRALAHCGAGIPAEMEKEMSGDQ